MLEALVKGNGHSLMSWSKLVSTSGLKPYSKVVSNLQALFFSCNVI